MRKIIVATLLCVLMLGSVAGAEGNLLLNGSFEMLEANWPTGWLKDMWLSDEGVSYLEVREPGKEDEHCVMIENVVSNDARFVQDVAVQSDTVYRLSGWVKAENCNENFAGASLSVIGSFVSLPEVHDTAGEWVFLESYVRTAPSHSKLTIGPRLGDYSADNTGKAFFDNLVFEKVTEVPQGATIFSLSDYSQNKQNVVEVEPEAEEAKVGVDILSMALAFLVLLAVLQALQHKRIPYAYVLVWGLLAMAVVVRIYLMATQPGYETDMGCFFAWSNRMVDVGPQQFYAPDYFCDYPPGYMYIMWITGQLMRLFGVTGLDEVGRIVVKSIPMVMEVATVWLLWRLARKRVGDTGALLLCALYAFSPAILVDGAIWGQVDAVLALGLLGTVALAVQGNWIAALPVFAVTVLMKPQALMAGPIGLVALLMDIFPWRRGKSSRELGHAGIGLGISLAVVVAMLLPFVWGKASPISWVIEKYATTLGSYNYATINTANFFYLIGANWTPLDALLGPLSYGTWGTIAMVVVVVGLMALYIWRRGKEWLPFFCAMVYLGLYVFGVKMHERYLFPAFVLLLYAYILRRDFRILLMFGGLSLTFFINCAWVLNDLHLPLGFVPAGMILSAVNILFFGVGLWVIFDGKQRLLKKHVPEKETPEMVQALLFPQGGADIHDEKQATLEEIRELLDIKKPEEASEEQAEETPDTSHITLSMARRLANVQGKSKPPARMRRKDWLLIIGLTAVYAVIAFVGLGATEAPQTVWKSTGAEEQVVIDLGEYHTFTMMYYPEIVGRDHTFTLEFSDDGVAWYDSVPLKVTPGDCFRWLVATSASYDENGIPTSWSQDRLILTGRYVRLTAQIPGLSLMELSFRDIEDGSVIHAQSAVAYGARAESAVDPLHLIDEPDVAPEYPSYYNGTYFDEIYHARTGYEHAHGMSTYEWTHPPLGKVFMMWAIQLFGMTPFGWRFAGALAGVLMVPAMYMLGKVLFRKSRYAFLAAFVMAFDMMHLTQTRIATIDSFAVLFIILMYTCMFRYMQMSFFRDGWRTLIPLALSGLFMGLGCASKWICMYAAVGLAVLWAWTMVQRFLEWRAGVRAGGIWAERVQAYPRYLLGTVGACILCFLVIPFAIYYFSYIPQFAWEGGLTWKRFWSTQEAIFGYHANLVDDHAFKSPWYEWPLMLKPMYYFQGKPYVQAGMVSTIMAMGNPAVWWVGFVAFLYVGWRWLKPHLRGERATDHRPAMILLAFAAQFVPWVLVPRSMFIYHYFGSLPFVMLSIVYALEQMKKSGKRWPDVLQGVYMALVVALFVAFYPVGTGVQVPEAWARSVNWLSFLKLPGWKFQGWIYY